jgi:predicted permease
MERELKEEMDFHLQMEARKLMKAGLSAEAAYRQALRSFGEPLREQERARDAWGVRWIQDFRSDLRLALRAARRSPVLSVTAIATIALGIGGATAIFTVVNGVLLKPLPYPDSGTLVALNHTMPGIDAPSTPIGPALFFTYEDHARSLEGIGLWQASVRTVTGLAEPERVATLLVTEGLLPVLGVHPVLGRGFTREDTHPESGSPAILSDAYWSTRFGADPNILDRTIRIDGEEHPIVGILPPGTRIQDREADLILPLRFDRESTGVGNWSFSGIARLKPGINPEQATAELSQLTPLACELYPGIPLEELRRRGFGTVATPLKQAMVGDSKSVLWVLFGTVALVLFIACTNVANLFLVKAESGARDTALRKALGASKARLIRQAMADSLLMGGIGGGIGVFLAYGGVRAFLRMAPPSLPRVEEIGLAPAVLLFALSITILAAMAFGLISVSRGRGGSLTNPLKEGSRGAGDGRGRVRARNLFATVQIALALVLLVGSGLMVRTFIALGSVPPGYQRPAEVVTFRLSIPRAEAATGQDAARAHQEIVRRLMEIPGVTSVSAAASVAMEPWEAWEDLYMEDFPVAEGDPNPLRRLNWITPGHFETLQNPVKLGRSFEWAEVLERRHVAVVNEALAREFWPNPEQAVGKRFRMGENQPWKEIIGIAGDVRARGVREDPPSIVYFPFLMEGLWGTGVFSQRSLRYAVRTTRQPATDVLPDARQAVESVSPNLPLSSITTLDQIFARSIAQTSFAMTMLGMAAAVAVVLGMVGVYGVISYLVSQRTREMGIRLAMGATATQVRRMILKKAWMIASTGIAFGVGLALAFSHLMVSLLFGVEGSDPLTYAIVSVSLVGVVLLASYLPARRAAGVNPTEALRGD